VEIRHNLHKEFKGSTKEGKGGPVQRAEGQDRVAEVTEVRKNLNPGAGKVGH